MATRSTTRRSQPTRVHADVPAKAAKSAWEHVYRIARAIPRGRVMTYGQISDLLGGTLSPKAVGWAMHTCPDDVPWHRVINAAGRCSTDRRGDIPLGMQQGMLRAEGVEFRLDGSLDLDVYRHHPARRPRNPKSPR